MKSPKTVIFSIIGLIFVIAAFTITPWLMIVAAFFSWLGWKELYKK